jgi:hypothetical protein
VTPSQSGSTQAPFTQPWPAAHAPPSHETGTHWPRTQSSLSPQGTSRHARSRQCSPMQTCSAPHCAVAQVLASQPPCAQAWSASHACPHTPQFRSSLAVSTQLPPQAVSPPAHCTPPSRGSTRITGSKQPDTSSTPQTSRRIMASPMRQRTATALLHMPSPTRQRGARALLHMPSPGRQRGARALLRMPSPTRRRSAWVLLHMPSPTRQRSARALLQAGWESSPRPLRTSLPTCWRAVLAAQRRIGRANA